ncbi:MAG: hypothetical protein QOH57_1412 [Mycobacterium sp.]|jgi:hypothetical protein|nr:hypothetical protein [Mycobacterium sp.]
MIRTARTWLALTGATAASVAGIVCLTSPAATAEPMPPMPAPVTVTQTVTVAPLAAAPAPVAPAPAANPPRAVVAPAALAPPAATAPTVTQPGAAAAPAPPALVPATSGTLRDFLIGKHIAFEPQRPAGFSALSITLPMPPGWTQVPDPNVPDAFAVIANRSSPDLYTPNAQVVVYKLVGDFDPKDAITHGFIDSQSLPAWQTTDSSLADFYGMPSAAIEGTYRQNAMTLNMTRRHVIATTGTGRYLVTLTVSTQAGRQAAPVAADATDAIVNGFRVTPPAPAPAS